MLARAVFVLAACACLCVDAAGQTPPTVRVIVPACGDGFGRFLREQNDAMGPIVREAGIKLE